MLIVKCLRGFFQMFEYKHSVSMKSRRRSLHLSSFSKGFVTAGPAFSCKDSFLSLWKSIFDFGSPGRL